MPTDEPAFNPQVEQARSAMAQGERFIADHLASCCAELTSLYDSGTLPDGYLRALAKIYRATDTANAMEMALSAVARAAIRRVAVDTTPAPTAEIGR